MTNETPEIHGLTSEQSDQVAKALDYVAEKSKAEGIEIGRQQATGDFIKNLPEAKTNPALAEKLANDPKMTVNKALEYLKTSRQDQLKRAIRAI